jgi:RNA polymerase sigma-70 factor (ECF subfamily)
MADVGVEADLVQRAAAGDAGARGALLTEHEARLCCMAAFRPDPRPRGRVDAADVVQEACAEAADHRQDYFRLAQATPVPVFLWLRGIAGNKLPELHRHHLGTRMRDAAREAAPRPRATPDATSAALVDQLSAHGTGPRTAAARAEVKVRLHEALGSMDATDREVLALRHFEQLTNGEAAAVLGIAERAAAKRYVRAVRRLKCVLAGMPGGLTEIRP